MSARRVSQRRRRACTRAARARGFNSASPYRYIFGHQPRSQIRRGNLALAVISVGDAGSMLDRYWRSERCGWSPWRPKLDRLASLGPEMVTHHAVCISTVNPPRSSLEDERRLATRSSSQVTAKNQAARFDRSQRGSSFGTVTAFLIRLCGSCLFDEREILPTPPPNQLLEDEEVRRSWMAVVCQREGTT
jgi:hypothetical protein